MDDIERCDREIAEILDREDVKAGAAPAWLVTLGINDWQTEKRLIIAESEALRGTMHKASELLAVSCSLRGVRE